jgi:hypothetical protein
MKDDLPTDWSEDKIKRVIDHYESQSEDEAIAEDKAAFTVEKTLMQIPIELVADVRAHCKTAGKALRLLLAA